MPIVISNPCGTDAVPQALPIMQGRECSRSMDSGNLNHGHAICADDLSFAGLRSVHGRIDGHVMGGRECALWRGPCKSRGNPCLLWLWDVGGFCQDTCCCFLSNGWWLVVGGGWWLVVCFLSTVT